MQRTRTRAVVIVAACGALVASCGRSDGYSDGGGAPAETQRASAPEPGADRSAAAQPAAKSEADRKRGPKVRLRDSPLGRVLFDGHNRALYLFTKDGAGRARCYGACAKAWPPFYAKGRPRAGRGVNRSLLGTIRRRGGRRQVTYKDQPLYFYVADPRGQVLCNDVVEFGGTWYALDAKGDPPG